MPQTIRVLAVGDVVGEPGRQACRRILPRLREREKIDFIFANGENLAGGSGVTAETAEEIFRTGVDLVTSGDHIFKKKEAIEYVAKEPRLLRPANYPASAPGHGSTLVAVKGLPFQLGIINLVGRVFMDAVDCPFQAAHRLVNELHQQTPLVFVDMHAEATSEKIAMGWYLDGRVSAVVGTHTHVQTADEQILPKGTAYITDLGMTGPFRSVIGREIEPVLTRFVTRVPSRYGVATEDIRLNGVLIEVDVETGRAVSIRRVQEKMDDYCG